MQEMFGYVGGITHIRITRIPDMLLYPGLELAGSASNVIQITDRTSYRVHNMVRVTVNKSLNCAVLTTDGILNKGSFDSIAAHGTSITPTFMETFLGQPVSGLYILWHAGR